MAGVSLRETSLRDSWRHSPAKQACVVFAGTMTSASVGAVLVVFLKGQRRQKHASKALMAFLN